MSTNDYVVLRSRNIITPTIDNLGAPRERSRPTAHGLMARPEVSMHAERVEIPRESIEITEEKLSHKDRSELRHNPNVRAIAPPMPIKLIGPIEKDAEPPVLSSSTWGIRAVRATESPYDGSGITVAVLDTGIDLTHPAFKDIKGKIVQRNFTSGSDDDKDGHGTHCAGTIFGQDVDGKRIGIARNIQRALIGKVFGEDKSGGSSKTIAEAILWAVQEGAHVISMSFGIDFPGYVNKLVNDHGYDINPATSMALEGYRANVNLFAKLADLVMEDAFKNGAVIVAASGNESNREGASPYEIAVSPPAAATGVVAVGALGETIKGINVAHFSNDQVDVSAPGVGVVSAALGGGFTRMSGTSMATPHVAGVAALWAQSLRDEETGHVRSSSLLHNLIASGKTGPLVSDIQGEDVGTGIVQAP